jgi:uroporphyrinogen decarboxylase
MRPRERVLKALRHEEPDRPPIHATVTPQVGEALNQALGIEDEGLVDAFFANRISYTPALLKLGNDCVGVGACTAPGFIHRQHPDGSTTDEWGITTRETDLYNEMVAHPLAEIENVKDLEHYPFPDPLAAGRFDWAEETVKTYGEDYALVGEQECTIFELSWYLVGLEKFLLDMALGNAYVFELLDRVMEFSLQQAARLIDLGVDIILFGDDMGDQNGMMISPAMWRSIFKPRMLHIFQTVKKLNPDIQIAYHSCGSILPIIPDLIEIGLDILNPLQPLAAGMDAKYLKSTYGEKLSFYGAIDIQNLLPRGSPREIKKTVKDKIAILGRGGGYIVAPAHNIQPDTPLENIFAFFEAARE